MKPSLELRLESIGNIKVPSVSVANLLPHKTPNGCPRTARDDEPANPSKK
jgi:hypothetical protein